MFALVESGSITKYIRGNRGITIGDIQYPKSIFTLWSASQREAIGIYEIEVDTSKRKDEKWYVNTNITYSFGSGKVTGVYGDATAKAHADTLYTQAEADNDECLDSDVGNVKTRGLKYNLIKDLKITVASELSKTDWYIIRNTEKSTAIPSSITTHRNAVRTKQAEMETSITNAADTPALETLYTYTKQEDGSVTRPLGELPTLES